jgi:magnesium-transporting ATPase (P-type)
MLEVWFLATSFPSVIYTVLLGVVLVYWTFVIAGVVDLDSADPGGSIEGATKGALEGATKGALEGATKGALEGLGGDGDIDLDVDADIDGHETGVLAALMSALHLGRVPVTTVLSLLVTFSWLSSVVSMQVVTRILAGFGGAFTSWLVLLAAPLLALPLTILAVRPLSRVFVEKRVTSRADLIGKTCVVRTGKVTEAFGEGTLEDGGAGLVVRVRVDGDKALQRGDHALIVEWDAKRDAFVVEPMASLLEERSRNRERQ